MLSNLMSRIFLVAFVVGCKLLKGRLQPGGCERSVLLQKTQELGWLPHMSSTRHLVRAIYWGLKAFRLPLYQMLPTSKQVSVPSFCVLCLHASFSLQALGSASAAAYCTPDLADPSEEALESHRSLHHAGLPQIFLANQLLRSQHRSTSNLRQHNTVNLSSTPLSTLKCTMQHLHRSRLQSGMESSI
jgi:hypothetical protein